jgi:hypothetical protein
LLSFFVVSERESRSEDQDCKTDEERPDSETEDVLLKADGRVEAAAAGDIRAFNGGGPPHIFSKGTICQHEPQHLGLLVHLQSFVSL